MVNYSILDPTKVEIDNITVKINEGEYAGTILTYDPITMGDDGKIRYGIVIDTAVKNGNPVKMTTIDSQLLSAAGAIFEDVLKLFKDNIQYT